MGTVSDLGPTMRWTKSSGRERVVRLVKGVFHSTTPPPFFGTETMPWMYSSHWIACGPCGRDG